jgi:nanoRNase/pAp phosphatase (c-di-AMP/oligoRNAs hydrolase)
VDVRSVAEHWHGGGHKNAAGCTLTGDYLALKAELTNATGRAIDEATGE